MYESIKASILNPEKYSKHTSVIGWSYKTEQIKKAREEAFKDERALLCEDCPIRYAEHGRCACGHVNKEDRLPDWAGGQNQCLRYAIERLGLRGWIQPSGDPFIITEEAARTLAAALDELE